MTKAQVIALIDQYITTNGNEEITGAQTNSVMKALANQDIPFSEIVSKPTTLSGYGITDAYTKSVSDDRYVNVTGDTMTGDLVIETSIRSTNRQMVTESGSHLFLGDYAGGTNQVSLRGSANPTFYNGTYNTLWHSGIHRSDSQNDSRYAIMNDISQNLGQLTIRTDNSNSRGLRLLNNSTGQSSFLYMDNSNDLNINNSSSSSRPVYINKGGGGGLKVGGNITATAFFESSDIRLKENIQPLNYGLNEIEKIDTHTWNWKNNNESDIGLIAQELEAVLPELVRTDEEGYKSVNYPKLVPILINSIKDLSNQVKALKNG